MKNIKNLGRDKWVCVIVLLLTLWIPTNAQNVGIGTTNPDEKLTVVGTIKSSIDSDSNFPQFQIHQADNEYGRIKYTNTSSSQYFMLAGKPQLDSTMARFHISNSDFGNIGSFTGHGRFGINASNPVAAFHVNAQPNTDLLRIQIDNATKFRIFSNDAMVFGSNWASPIPDVIRFETPNMFIGFDGNHIPVERLEVDGVIKASGLKIPFGHQEGYVLTSDIDGNASWTNSNQNQTLSKVINKISISGGNTIGLNSIGSNDDSSFLLAGTSRVSIALDGPNRFRFTNSGDKSHLLFLESNRNISISGSDQISTITSSGFDNVSIGPNAGEIVVSGVSNVIIGDHASTSYLGYSNIHIGRNVAYLSSDGQENILIGSDSGASVDGDNNVCIGRGAGWNAGDNSINIGKLAGSGPISYSDGGAIGTSSVNTADNQYVIGTSATTEIGGFQPWSNLSDGRFKFNVQENIPGLDFIVALKPVSYQVDREKVEKFTRGEEYYKKLPPNFVASLKKRKQTRESGFIAQEVEKAATALGYDFNGVVLPQNDHDPYALAYSQFVVPLVKAVQELDQKNQVLEKQNSKLENDLNLLRSEIDNIKKMLSKIK